ncbi:MAG: endolytic transglycosylase MltG [Terriglobia bacterium]
MFSSLTVLGILGAVVICLAMLWHRPFKGFRENQKLILLEKGTSSYQIAMVLQQEGVIRHWYGMLSYLKIMKRSAHLQAGEYQFDRPLSIAQVAEKLIRGQVYYREVTIPEGYSIFDIAELMQQKGFLTSDAFFQAARQVNKLADVVEVKGTLEGYLFPDTYRLTRGTQADEFISMMLMKFRDIYKKKLETPLKDSPYSVNEIMTMASLVEKETGLDEERPLVAAVFYNRLRRKMPLQCDPTVIYAALLNGDFKGKIYQSDLQSNSSYNTYLRLGLPPTPISNPGIRSIEAALFPANVDYLYFVSNNQGGHIFSKTLEEHLKAVASYRRESARKSHS